MSVEYFGQLLSAARPVHFVYLAQLLGAVLFIHFISNHDKGRNGKSQIYSIVQKGIKENRNTPTETTLVDIQMMVDSLWGNLIGLKRKNSLIFSSKPHRKKKLYS